MEKILVWTDEQAKKEQAAKWDKEKSDVQVVVDLYRATKLPALAGDDLHRMLNDTENFMFDKIAGGEQAHLTIGTGDTAFHLPLVKSKAIEILQKPVGYTELRAGIEHLVKTSISGTSLDIKWNIQLVARYFEIDSDGQVQYTAEKAKQLAEHGNKYVQSECGKQLYGFITDVMAMYRKHNMDSVIGSFTDRKGCNPAIILQSLAQQMDGEKWIPASRLYEIDEQKSRIEQQRKG